MSGAAQLFIQGSHIHQRQVHMRGDIDGESTVWGHHSREDLKRLEAVLQRHLGVALGQIGDTVSDTL